MFKAPKFKKKSQQQRFANQKLCLANGFSSNGPRRKFMLENRRYYQEVEDYDWVTVADKFRGPEAILHRLRARMTLKLVKEFGKSGQYLDVGCGTGLILRHLNTGATGLDINPRNIKRAKIHAPRAKLVLGDICRLPFPAASFDTVICTEVLEHLLEPNKALNEIWRVLRPGGVLIGSVPRKNPLWQLRFLSSTHPGEPYHRLYGQAEIPLLIKSKKKLLLLKPACLGMNIFFVVKNHG